MISLREYQKNAILTIHETFSKEKRQYIEMPTGAGKTITFLSYARSYQKKVLVIVPSRQLMKQVVESALLFYDPWEISRKGDRYDDDFSIIEPWQIEKYGSFENVPLIHVCIINSIRADYLYTLCDFAFDLIIFDEAHHTQSNSYIRFIDLYTQQFPNVNLLGVTATPDRADGKMLSQILHTSSFKLFIEDLIEQKHLVDIEGFSVKTKINIEDVESKNGDFSINQLYKKLCVDSRNEMIISLCKKEMKDRKSLIFCINVEHSKIINKMMNQNGISSLHIDGSMKEEQRNSILTAFREGKISFLCNCQLLTEGFDEPSIDGIILARPTTSRALFLQMIGRGLRLSPGKSNCKIIDIVDNHRFSSGFNNILTDENYPKIQSFKNIKDIKDYLINERIKITEFYVEHANLLGSTKIDEFQATPSMIEYLDENKIYYQSPISFDEGSFLIWMNELKKEYVNGCH